MSFNQAPVMKDLLLDGVVRKNPIFVLALSLCPAVAVTSTAITSFMMGISVLYVLTMSNVLTSLTRAIVPHKIRVPVYITFIAFNVTFVQLVMSAYLPDLYDALGVYLALVVVFAIILARSEVFACKNKLFPSFVDGFSMGLGFLLGLLLIGIIREFLGGGTFFGMVILTEEQFPPILMLILPPGGFVVIGLLIGAFNHIGDWNRKRSLTEAAPKVCAVPNVPAAEQ